MHLVYTSLCIVSSRQQGNLYHTPIRRGTEPYGSILYEKNNISIKMKERENIFSFFFEATGHFLGTEGTYSGTTLGPLSRGLTREKKEKSVLLL